jgi:hypothetical protein
MTVWNPTQMTKQEREELEHIIKRGILRAVIDLLGVALLAWVVAQWVKVAIEWWRH